MMQNVLKSIQHVFDRHIPSMLSLLLITGFLSCNKLVETSPKDRLETSYVFADSTNATAAVVGMYIDAMQIHNAASVLNGGMSILGGLSADELTPNSAPAEITQFYKNAVSSTVNNTNDAYLWNAVYRLIYAANACIEGVDRSTTLSASLKSQLIGEAKFVRAFNYFYLVNLYGAVPLVVTTDYRVNGIMPRTQTDKVYLQIEKDLIEAKDLLTSNYVTPGRFRPNRYAAIALLSKMYLYRQEWAKAELLATEVINNTSIFTLETNLNTVFLPASKEAIFQLRPVAPGTETNQGRFFVPANLNVIPTYTLSAGLLSSFEANDKRFTNWVAKNTVAGNDYYYPYKYKLRTGVAGSTNYQEATNVLRLADIILVRAEARAKLSNITGSLSDLNTVRTRAGLNSFSTNNESLLLSAIYNERRIEFFAEFGNRWFDIKRTGQVDAIMTAAATAKGITWNSNFQLYPIPFSQIQTNPFLVQNPGYQ